MRTLFFVLGALVAVAFGFWAYRVNYETQSTAKRVTALQNQIAAERENMTMLRAEWAWLNRPSRIEALVAANNDVLGLGPLQPDHFGEVNMVAWPPLVAKDLEEGWDGITREDITVTEISEADPTPRPHHRPDIIEAKAAQ
ncbi:cell division protein FtsL [Oceanicella sp. SM1341]|uniref:cell division protein FtsL n=1 Tax=Oceanicella sp. SM1341 TaxID=1548889 RepID=UPI0018E584A1|nr:cell division protein FtsL [Oceanicella sp. SM1341]